MTEQMSLEQAAAALRRHYGGKPLEASHEDGPDLMSEAMRMETGIAKPEADALVRALMDAQTIRWVAGGVQEGERGRWEI
jgi:hypothetical protein